MKSGILLKFKMAAHRTRGQALVMTLLILAAILAIALAVTNIFIVEIRLAGDVGESAKAVMAADSGLEWALYKERKILPDDPNPYPTFNGSPCVGANCALSNNSFFEVAKSTSGAKTVIRSIGGYLKTRRGLQVSF